MTRKDLMVFESGLNLRPLLSEKFLHGPNHYRIFRSGNPGLMNAEDARLLKERYGIQYYFDLRSDEEVKKYGKPNRLIDQNIQWKSFSIGGFGRTVRENLEPDSRDYALFYLEILEEGAGRIKELFNFILEEDCFPFIYGCFAGKDRTGVISYLILHIIGASREEIFQDYQASTQHLMKKIDFFQSKWKKKGITKEKYQKRLQAEQETVILLEEMVQEKYGSIFNYLKELGFANEKLNQLKERFIKGGD